jgi:hypothetical protein
MAISCENSQEPSFSRVTTNFECMRRRTLNRIGSLRSEGREVPPKSCCGKFHHIDNEKRRRVYECYWAHFAAEIHLSE